MRMGEEGKGETAYIRITPQRKERAYGIMFMIHSLWISQSYLLKKLRKESNALPLNSHIPK